jgi:hypothetical protein
MMQGYKSFFSGFKDGFTEFGHFMTDAANYFMLSIVYFFGVGFVSLVAKISGKQFLKLKKSGKKESCWVEKKTGGSDLDSYYKQF